MPPDGRLDPEALDALRAWVEMGAPWPEGGPVAASAPSDATPAFTEEQRSYWAFQPISDPAPPSFAGSSASAIDGFIGAKLEAEGLESAPPAGKLTLLRRVRESVSPRGLSKSGGRRTRRIRFDSRRQPSRTFGKRSARARAVAHRSRAPSHRESDGESRVAVAFRRRVSPYTEQLRKDGGGPEPSRASRLSRPSFRRERLVDQGSASPHPALEHLSHVE